MANNWQAYREGKQASIDNKSNPKLVNNPYPLGSSDWKDWNYGWNSDGAWLDKIRGTIPDLKESE